MAPKTRTLQKQATRERLINTACFVFAEKGIVSTSTMDIARAADVAHGTLFVHFSDRDTLVATVIEEYTIRIAERVRQLVMGNEPTLQAFLRAHVEGIREQEAFYARLVAEGPLLPKTARSRLVILQSAVAYFFDQAVDRERSAHRIREAPVGLLFNTWLGLLHHYVCNPDLFGQDGSVLAGRGSALVEHFLALVKA